MRCRPGAFPRFPALLVLTLLLAGAVLAAPAGGGDGTARRLLLPAVDPLLRSTDDPRLLGVERLWWRERFLAWGVDPRQGIAPTLDTYWRKLVRDRLHVDLERRLTVVEDNGFHGLTTTFQYPTWFFLYTTEETLPGGFVYFPPRPVDAPEVELFVDDLSTALARRHAVRNRLLWYTNLDLRSGRPGGADQQGLINLTIPIKLPRTLEKIIGRGEKTNIKITGREHISISGESTVSNRFTPTERRRSQSLFPSLDMEQQLQINLSGQIGEKVHLEVDHNSEAIGPDATKIRLWYEGTEDEIIQSIETGDVGLTLPGSQLLGYSSNKSGLFGIKVIGQVGRTDFTFVASKQKAESASKSFNSRGGTAQERTIEAWRYLNNRFFRLDLPPNDIVSYARPDYPGRDAVHEHIDLNSIQVYKFEGAATPRNDFVRDIVALPDTTGRWIPGALAYELQNPSPGQIWGEWWSPVEYDVFKDENDNLVALDLLREYDYHDILAVVYQVVDDEGNLLYQVGDYPGIDDDNRIPDEEGRLFYRLKLLKPQNPEPYTWQYVLRNIYSLGGANIDPSSFDLKIEINAFTDYPHLDLDNQGNGSGLDWFRIFGLDRFDQQGNPHPDGLVDIGDPYLFDFNRGLLKFPVDVPEPFNAPPEVYTAFADTSAFDFDGSLLSDNLMPEIYDPETTPQQMATFSRFKFVVTSSAASSSFNLGVSNIEEGSETVVLDGRTLVRDVDYTIDYTFGQVTLKGEAAASLTADSQISVTYQYAPFLGGGNSSLVGANLGMDLGAESRLSTTWLYQSKQVVGHKAKLGEEPSRILVGDINGQFTLKPWLLTHVANFLSRRDSDRESKVQINGELATSMPNPNTFNEVYVEDFEGIDSSDQMPVSRLSWQLASAPVQGEDPGYLVQDPDIGNRHFTPEKRLVTRWFLPRENTLRLYLNPELRQQEAREAQQVLEIYLSTGGQPWEPDNWGGIMRGLGRSGLDLTKTQFVEFWVNDFRSDVFGEHPSGKLHIDFGYINEDFYWPVDDSGELVTGTFNREDGILGDPPDGVFTIDEDIGLGGDPERDRFSADYGSDADPYPYINGTAGNNREDSEDLDGDTVFDRQDGYFTLTVDLADSALIDVLRDYPAGEVSENLDRHLAWRKYRVRLGDALTVSPPGGTTPQLATVTHVRIWFEDSNPDPSVTSRRIQLTDLRFLGSRWEREGVRRIAGADSPLEQILPEAERLPGEAFFIGEVNNKENPDYSPPFSVHVTNNIPEKEQSMVLDFENLGQGHLVRASRLLSPNGEDFTRYHRVTWYVFNPTPDQASLEVFFRLGADTLNFYEVNYRFDEQEGARTGWKEIRLDLAELANVKLQERDPVTGWVEGTIPDPETGQRYRVRVVGGPDLRRVKRLYMGVRNTDQSLPATGYFYFNDVRLREVKKDKGLAERLALRVNMGDVLKVDFDWSRRDADFHGLNSETGQGFTNENWNLSTSFRVDDFIPLLGFRLPVSLGKQRSTRRPKYVTNSDIEIIDEALREEQSSISNRENFAVRLQRPPSQHALLRYLVDPWSLSLSGSRSEDFSPLGQNRTKNLQGSISYDLRIGGRHQLGDLGPLHYVPIVKAVGLLPSKISLTGNFSGSTRHSSTYNATTGIYVPQPVNRTRQGTLTGQISYRPLPFADVSVSVRSDRDLFRTRKLWLLNIGEETVYNQQVQLRLSPPTKLGLPDTWFFRPLTMLSRSMRSVRPSITYNGSFNNNHAPYVRQGDDPPGTGNLQNKGDWNIGLSLPLGDLVEHFFPRHTGLSDAERRARIERERRMGRRRQRLGGGARGEGRRGGGGETELPRGGGRGPGPAGELTEEERRRREEQELLERSLEEERQSAARRRAEREAAADTAASDSTAGLGEPAGGGRRFKLRLPNPLRPLLALGRSLEPIQVTWTRSRQSSYSRFREEAPFWYKVGFWQRIDVPDSLFVNHGETYKRNLSLSTNAKLTSSIAIAAKYNRSEDERESAGLLTRAENETWPDLRLTLSGLERWGIFGGPSHGVFRSAMLDVTYKETTNIPSSNAANRQESTSKQFAPRLTFTFQSGLTTTLNVSTKNDRQDQNGILSLGRQLAVGLQVRHSFNAETLLARLGLYKPGSSPLITMDVDISYARNVTDRWFAGIDRDGEPSTQTGTTRLNVNPRFSYQINRNLSGALRFIYSRNKTLETDLVTQRFGLGLEATFVF